MKDECPNCTALVHDAPCDPNDFPVAPQERDEDDPYPDRVMVDAQGRPHYEP